MQQYISKFRPKLAAILLDAPLNTARGCDEIEDNTFEGAVDPDECQMIMNRKEWVTSSKPHPIGITLKKLQEIIDTSKHMDQDCFNMGVRMIACEETVFLRDPLCHYLDLQFSVSIDIPYSINIILQT